MRRWRAIARIAAPGIAVLAAGPEYPTLEKRFVPSFLDTISEWILARTPP